MEEVLPEKLFSARLQEVVDRFGSAEKLAKAARVSSRVIGKYLSGESLPGMGNLVSIARAANANVEWLATGEGPKWKNREGSSSSAPRGSAVECEGLSADEFVLVPRYDVEASAGYGALVHSEQIVDHLAFKRRWVRDLGITPERLALITARGDSMEPTINDGDLLLVDTSPDAARVDKLFDGIYVFSTDHQLVVKRLLKHVSGGFDIKSDNPKYGSEFITIDQIEGGIVRILGRVVWGGGKM